MKKTKFILLLAMFLIVQSMAENNATRYNETNDTTSYSSFVNLHDSNVTKSYFMVKKVANPPKKTLLEVEAEARAIIAEEVAKVEIVKANALAVIARAVASVEIAKIREEQEKESSSDLF